MQPWYRVSLDGITVQGVNYDLITIYDTWLEGTRCGCWRSTAIVFLRSHRTEQNTIDVKYPRGSKCNEESLVLLFPSASSWRCTCVKRVRGSLPAGCSTWIERYRVTRNEPLFPGHPRMGLLTPIVPRTRKGGHAPRAPPRSRLPPRELVDLCGYRSSGLPRRKGGFCERVTRGSPDGTGRLCLDLTHLASSPLLSWVRSFTSSPNPSSWFSIAVPAISGYRY